MAQRDAVGVNESNRIITRGTPPQRMTPNGCLGIPAIVLTEASSWISLTSAHSEVAIARPRRFVLTHLMGDWTERSLPNWSWLIP